MKVVIVDVADADPWLVDHGVAKPEAVELAVKEGLARRWRFTGPFETIALGGPHVFSAVAANLFAELSTAREAGDLARVDSVDETALTKLRERRDRGLANEQRDGR